MIVQRLDDAVEFRRRRALAWERNLEYWLNGPLRHVDDVGHYIVDRVLALSLSKGTTDPLIVDMGFGSAWLLKALIHSGSKFSYCGLDVAEEFVKRATTAYGNFPKAKFLVADLEREQNLGMRADIIVNAFNFFELCDLKCAMANAARHLKPTGTLLMSTIDKTYLILAISENWVEFHENLTRYQELQGIKYQFQQIDMDNHVSDKLEYPSVLFSTQDYIDAAEENGLHLVKYTEHIFTAKLVPKIYCHLEFQFNDDVRL